MSAQTITPKNRVFPLANTEVGWFLIGCPSGNSVENIPIASESFVLGRRAESSLRLKSPCVSGRHAEILIVDDHLFLRDLDSTNGTFLNRIPVKSPTRVESGDHIQIADVEFRVEYRDDQSHDDSNLREQAKTHPSVNAFHSEWVMSQLEDLIRKKSINPHYQPILDLNTKKTVGFESLARSDVSGLESPLRMFETAEIVNREVQLSIICREIAIRKFPKFDPCPAIFVNTHPHESLEVDVIPTIGLLREARPDVPIVVEFHEKTIQSSHIMLENKAMLADLGVKIAYDDFGAGQSRLLELVQAPPDYLKFDRSLISGLHEANAYHHRMLELLIKTAGEFGIVTLAEGVEEVEEAEAAREIGFDLVQGYLFGRPSPVPQFLS